MPHVVTLTGFRPSPRYDATPWTHAVIDESPSAAGPWTQIDDQALVPVDPDPTQPALRNFTTVAAQLEEGWYRITFVDAAANTQLTDPVYGPGDVSLPVTIDDIRGRSALLKARYPAEPYVPDVEDALRSLVTDAVALVESLTCRKIDATLPDDLIAVAVRAVMLKAEQLAVSGTAEETERTVGGKRLRGFTAGPYSETYFAPGELGVKNGRPRVDPSDALDEALWALMTDECREQFIAYATGKQAPAGAVSEFDYRRMGGARVASGWPGPDGF